MFDTKLEQAKIQQLMNREKYAEYDLRNQYPVIVTDPIGFTPAFNPSNVDTDYIDTALTGNLVYTTHYADQSPFTSTVNLYDLQSNVSSTGSTAGMHEIVVETTSNENIKTYTRTDVPVLAGYLEEVPFIHPTSGSVHNFTQLGSLTEIPKGQYHGNQRARVQVTGSYLPATTRDYTISLWLHPNALSTGGNYIDSNNALGASHSLMMSLPGGGQSRGTFSPGTANFTHTAIEYFAVGNRGRWMHLVMTVSSTGELKVYRDGTLSINTTFEPTHDLDLSGDFTITSPYESRVDSVDFANQVLSADDALDLYNAGQGKRFLSYYFDRPTITLLGDNPMTITDLSSATDPSATATDLQDGDITNSIDSDWDDYIDTNTLNGNYTITYSVTDSDGNTTTATRTVVVNDGCDISVMPNIYFDGTSTSSKIGTNSVTFVGTSALTTSLGKYDSYSFTFGTSGGNSMKLTSGIDLSTGIYTFSVWFYNMRTTTANGNYRALIKKDGSGTAGHGYPIIVNPNDELGLYDSSFTGNGYSMTNLENKQEWHHIAVVADGTNSTF